MALVPPVAGPPVRQRVNLSRDDRKAAYFMLLGMADGEELYRGAISTVADLFGVNRSTIIRLWREVRRRALSNQNLQPGDEEEAVDVYGTDAGLRRKGKYIHDREELKAATMALSPARRKKYRWLAASLDLPLSTVHFLTKQHQVFRKARSTIKPTLKRRLRQQAISK